MTSSLPSPGSGNGPVALIEAELQRQEEGVRLVQQLKVELQKLCAALHAALDGRTEEAASALKPATASIYLMLLSLASLRPPHRVKTLDPVYAIGSAVKSLDPEHLVDPHATTDALTRIEGAIDRADMLAANFCWDSRKGAATNPLSAAVGALLGSTIAAPRSHADALDLAKAVAKDLRSAAGSIGTGHLLSTEA